MYQRAEDKARRKTAARQPSSADPSEARRVRYWRCPVEMPYDYRDGGGRCMGLRQWRGWPSWAWRQCTPVAAVARGRPRSVFRASFHGVGWKEANSRRGKVRANLVLGQRGLRPAGARRQRPERCLGGRPLSWWRMGACTCWY